MKIRVLIAWFILTSGFLPRDEVNFGHNHFRFVTQHLPNLLENDSSKVLLIGVNSLVQSDLCNQFPTIQFEELTLWYPEKWSKIIETHDWKGTFDCIVAMNIVERDPDREQTIQMAFDLLKNNGKALFYIDPQDQWSFDRNIEWRIRNSFLKDRIAIIPSLPLSEHQVILEKIGFTILNQGCDEYRVCFKGSCAAFLGVADYACPRWPVPKSNWDIELFAGEVKRCLNSPIFSEKIEDTLPTHYFILQK